MGFLVHSTKLVKVSDTMESPCYTLDISDFLSPNILPFLVSIKLPTFAFASQHILGRVFRVGALASGEEHDPTVVESRVAFRGLHWLLSEGEDPEYHSSLDLIALTSRSCPLVPASWSPGSVLVLSLPDLILQLPLSYEDTSIFPIRLHTA